MRPADELRLARQRPRAGKRPSPGHDSRDRQCPAPGTPARDHGGSSGSRAGSAEDRRGAEAGEAGGARKKRGAHRTALRARGAQAQRLERDAKRQRDRNAALEFPGADEEAQHPRARNRGRGGQSRRRRPGRVLKRSTAGRRRARRRSPAPVRHLTFESCRLSGSARRAGVNRRPTRRRTSS